jgi:hypothetical protein
LETALDFLTVMYSSSKLKPKKAMIDVPEMVDYILKKGKVDFVVVVTIDSYSFRTRMTTDFWWGTSDCRRELKETNKKVSNLLLVFL